MTTKRALCRDSAGAPLGVLSVLLDLIAEESVS
jgi:hypothetical protein